MAKETKTTQDTTYVILRLQEDGAWREFATTKAHNDDKAIDIATEGATESGTYKGVPQRNWKGITTVEVTTKPVVTRTRTEDETAASAPAQPEPPADAAS